MRHLIFLWLITTIFASPYAHAATITGQQFDQYSPPIRAMLAYCLPPIAQKSDVVSFLRSKQLEEFSAEQARPFSPSGGKAFAIPTDVGNSVLMTEGNYKDICSIAIKNTDPKIFWQISGQWFGAKSPFKFVKETKIPKEIGEATVREYQADFDGPVFLKLTIADQVQPSGIQGLMTITRPGK